MSSVGDWSWIPEVARQLGYSSIAELATVMGVTGQTISYWINGRSDPSLPHLLALADALSFESVDHLLTRAGLLDIDSATTFASQASTSEAKDLAFLVDRANVLKYTGRFSKLIRVSHNALREAESKGPIPAQLQFDVGYGKLMTGLGPEAAELASDARKLVSVAEYPLLVANTHWLEGEGLRVVGKLSQAEWQFEEGRQLYHSLGNIPSRREPGLMWIEWNLGSVYLAYGWHNRAREHFLALRRMAQTAWLAEGEIVGIWGLAAVDDALGKYDSAMEGFTEARQVANHVGDVFWEASSIWRAAGVLRKTGKLESALETAQTAREMFEEIGSRKAVAKVDCTIAACYLQAGMYQAALGLYETATDIFVLVDDWPMVNFARTGAGLARLCLEDQKPNPDFRPVFNVFRDIDARRPDQYSQSLAVYERLAHTEVLRLVGFEERSLLNYQALVTLCHKRGYLLEKAHALLGTAEAKRTRGEIDRSFCHEAIKIYKELGAKWGLLHSNITLALIDIAAGTSGASRLQRAEEIAKDMLPGSENVVVPSLTTAQSSGHRHILTFR